MRVVTSWGAETFANAVVGWFVRSLLDAIGLIIGDFFKETTRPHVTATEFIGAGGTYTVVASMSVLLLAGFTFLGVIQGLLSGEPGQALVRVLRDIPLAVLAIIGFPWLVDQLLTLADVLCSWILPSTDTATRILTVSAVNNIKGTGSGPAQLLIAVAAFTATVLIYLELVVRNDLVYLVVALSTLSFAGITMPAARPTARKAVETIIAIILAKPAMYIALRVGLDFLLVQEKGSPLGTSGWGKLIVGFTVIMLTACAPFVVWKLIPAAEGYVLAQGLSRAPMRAAMQAVQTAYWGQALLGGVRGRGPSGGGRGTGGGGGTSGDRPPTPGPSSAGRMGPPRSLPGTTGSSARPRPRSAAATTAGTAGGPGSPTDGGPRSPGPPGPPAAGTAEPVGTPTPSPAGGPGGGAEPWTPPRAGPRPSTRTPGQGDRSQRPGRRRIHPAGAADDQEADGDRP
ncbi:aminoglycoside adenyltransferase [Frankia sp. CiP3]|uniref:aminoglycoside adenyltransferase n=1 Tax=Frankia sp. CiP3 TaxID=2880971 RepID=UPI001EF5DE9C|nr:aminoglycoside adenyltransferase [Frankia sp. CiP3]